MYRLVLLLLLLVSPLLAPQLDREFAERILAVEKHWDKFIREYFGCPPTGPTDATTCNIAKSRLDLYEFQAACEASVKLYNLKDSCR